MSSSTTQALLADPWRRRCASPALRVLRVACALMVRALLPLAAITGTAACTTANPADVLADDDAQAPAQWIQTRVGRLAARVEGTGQRTLVLWPSILADHRIYDDVVRIWRRTYRIVFVDGPGHGESGPPPSRFDMAQCAQALAEVLDALGEREPVVVGGTSWGGLVAGEFAIAFPARTAAVVMLNAPVLAADPGLSDRFVTWGARWLHATRLYTDGVARAFFLPQTRARGGPMLARFHAHLHAADGEALALAVRSVLIEREALAPRLHRIAAPTLVVAGGSDGMYPSDTLRAASRELQAGTFVELQTAHVSVVDAPEAVATVVDDFLRGLPAGVSVAR